MACQNHHYDANNITPARTMILNDFEEKIFISAKRPKGIGLSGWKLC